MDKWTFRNTPAANSAGFVQTDMGRVVAEVRPVLVFNKPCGTMRDAQKDYEEAERRGRLLAAAPDLLDALDSFIAWAESNPEAIDDSPILAEAIRQGSAAIRKAYGVEG